MGLSGIKAKHVPPYIGLSDTAHPWCAACESAPALRKRNAGDVGDDF